MICILQCRLMNVHEARLQMVHPDVARNFDPHFDPMTASLSFKNNGSYKITSLRKIEYKRPVGKH